MLFCFAKRTHLPPTTGSIPSSAVFSPIVCNTGKVFASGCPSSRRSGPYTDQHPADAGPVRRFISSAAQPLSTTASAVPPAGEEPPRLALPGEARLLPKAREKAPGLGFCPSGAFRWIR